MLTHSREHGFALVSVLCAAAILAIIVASVLATSRSEIRLAQQDQQIAELSTVDGTPFTVSFAEQALRLTVQDEAGKIDLNMVQPDLLLRLLISTGVDPIAAQTLADRILD